MTAARFIYIPVFIKKITSIHETHTWFGWKYGLSPFPIMSNISINKSYNANHAPPSSSKNHNTNLIIRKEMTALSLSLYVDILLYFFPFEQQCHIDELHSLMLCSTTFYKQYSIITFWEIV